MHKEEVILLTHCAYVTSCEATTDGLASYSDAEDPADVTLQSSFALAKVLFSVTAGSTRRKFVHFTAEKLAPLLQEMLKPVLTTSSGFCQIPGTHTMLPITPVGIATSED